VTTVGYLGSFSGPPLIGLLAQATSLSGALLLLVAIAAALALLAGPALGRRDERVSRTRWRRWT
jgi:cyanate permease